jgi:hypothetical protein
MFGKKSMVVARSSLAVLCSALLAAAAQSQDDAPAASVRCVDLRRIDRTEIVGDRTILFHLTDRTIYHNQHPQAQLCDTDVVTVLERWGFGGFTPTESCLLGPFSPIDPAAAEALRAAANARENEPRR